MTGLAALGCTAAGPGPGEPGPPLPKVRNLRVYADNGSLTLVWDVDRAANQVFSGYNIYISERPILGTPEEEELLDLVRPFNRLPYPGDTDPDLTRETFLAQDLDNGLRYYCFVRALGSDGRPGTPTNEVMAICRRGGEAILQTIFSGNYDGFDFSAGRHVNSDAIDCDLAFYHKDGLDHLMAPSRIDPLLNQTRLWDLGVHEFDEISEANLAGEGELELKPQAGHVYAFRTAAGHYGKLRIASIADQKEIRTIRFTYMFQSIPNLVDLR